MKLVLDTCVLFPTITREVLLAAAEQKVFVPIVSDDILSEWHVTAHRKGQGFEVEADIAIAELTRRFPGSRHPIKDGVRARLWLPDANDIHILAVAVSAGADGIITKNAKDFPRHILAEEGISRLDPDAFLAQAMDANPEPMLAALGSVYNVAKQMSDDFDGPAALLKKARLNRLRKAFFRQSDLS